MSKEKNYITTGEAAAIFNVDPDSVLRWIKSGDIPAIRTPGGHYRISRDVFLTKMLKVYYTEERKESRFAIPYCWEYNSESGVIDKACEKCIVYTSRTSRCYNLCKLTETIGHAKHFCSESCEDCRYFQKFSKS